MDCWNDVEDSAATSGQEQVVLETFMPLERERCGQYRIDR